MNDTSLLLKTVTFIHTSVLDSQNLCKIPILYVELPQLTSYQHDVTQLFNKMQHFLPQGFDLLMLNYEPVLDHLQKKYTGHF